MIETWSIWLIFLHLNAWYTCIFYLFPDNENFFYTQKSALRTYVWNMPRSREDFLEIHQFCTFYPKITSPWGGESWNLQFLVSVPYRFYIPNFSYDRPSTSWEENVNGRRMTEDDGRQLIGKGHLGDSGKRILHPWVLGPR